MRRYAVFFGFLIAMSAAASVAHAESVYYVSRHPLPKRVGHGFCDIDVPHFHDYPPSDARLYREVNGQYYFVGDPTPFGYDGPRYSFYGPHPIADVNVQFGAPSYCYLKGPHYHWYSPPPTAQFEVRGGAYWYVGNYEPAFYAEQPRFGVVNEVYAPLVYDRPVIDVAIAPPAFRGEIVVGGPGWHGGPGPGWHEGPGWHGPEHHDVVMRERHEEWRHEEHRGWEHEHGPGWHGGPDHEHDRGWHGGPERPGWHPGPQAGPGWHGAPQQGPGWHQGGAQPAASFHPGAQAPHGGGAQPGFHAGGGGPAPHAAPHGNPGFHR